jgi:hypothetical protein
VEPTVLILEAKRFPRMKSKELRIVSPVLFTQVRAGQRLWRRTDHMALMEWHNNSNMDALTRQGSTWEEIALTNQPRRFLKVYSGHHALTRFHGAEYYRAIRQHLYKSRHNGSLISGDSKSEAIEKYDPYIHIQMAIGNIY